MKTKIIGLTGGICSGKSEVSNYLLTLMHQVIDADSIAKQLLSHPYNPNDKDSPLSQLVNYFGRIILDKENHLNRSKLRELIFTNKGETSTHKRFIDSIIHPAVYREIKQQIKTIKQQHSLIFVSIPLLVETADLTLFDGIIVVDCPIQLQIERCLKRDNSNEQQIKNLIDQQASREERLAIADYIVDNKTDKESLKHQVDQVLSKITNG